MIAAALQWLGDRVVEGMEVESIDAQRDLWNVGGRMQRGPLDPEVPRAGQHINLTTLAGLAAYLNDVDEEPMGTVIIVPRQDYVQAFHTLSDLDLGRDKRRMLAVAKFTGREVEERFTLPLREAILWLKSGCGGSGDRDALVELLSHVSVDENASIKETGVGQSVTMRKGVDTVIEEKIMPHYFLAPYRTFHEIRQPMSPFSMRLEQGGGYNTEAGPQVTFVCSDGGAWITEATNLVADWLRDACPEEIVLG